MRDGSQQMTKPATNPAEALFHAALDRPSHERRTFLDAACGSDVSLRTEVVALLEADARAARFLAGLSIVRDEGISPPAAPGLVGRRFGRYLVRERIAAGGMGVVYLAEQDQPRRSVALKVIRSGLASPELLRRFEHEAEVLGRLQHPNIAQIFEAGTADAGDGSQPFFAMEYVAGCALTEYANGQHLGLNARLQLFARVCDAVHYAHQQGVIHRDLKPENILVDTHGEPKILDFGVARVTDADVQVTIARTDIGQLVGTLQYMSPEQVAGDSSALDVRSDIYALGVIGYELLAGQMPYELRDRSIAEVARIVTHQEPTRLSVLNHACHGDLETILGKALEKDKTRRYQSAHELADDIRRHLDDEPISARAPSAMYQLRKFARRNRALVGGVLAAFCVLVLGIVSTSWQAVVATAERNRAQTAEQSAAQQASLARQESRKAEAINDFLVEMLASAQPGDRSADELTVRSLLDAAARRVDTQLADQPLVALELRGTIGMAYRGLGLYDVAEQHMLTAVDQARTLLGKEHEDTLYYLSQLALTYRAQGRFDEAERLGRQILESERHRVGARANETAYALADLSGTLDVAGKSDEAGTLLREALDILQANVGEDDATTVAAMNNLGFHLLERGELQEARQVLQRALDGSRRLHGAAHAKTLVTMVNLGAVLSALHELDEAEPLLDQAVAGLRRVLGDEHPDTLMALNELSQLYARQLRDEEALVCQRELLKIHRRIFPPEHPRVLAAINNLASALKRMGQVDEAEQLFREVAETIEGVLGPGHPNTLTSWNNLASLLSEAGRGDEAEPLFRDLVARSVKHLSEEHILTGVIRIGYALCLRDLQRFEEAEEQALAGFPVIEGRLGSQHPTTRQIAEQIAQIYDRWEKTDQAAEWRDKYAPVVSEQAPTEGDAPDQAP